MMLDPTRQAPERGFASTAAHFEALARKARDQDQQQRLLQVAGFYRSLAQIVPALPAGFQWAAGGLSRAERWKARAEECRTLADYYTDPTCRAQLTRLADGYDRMAIAAE